MENFTKARVFTLFGRQFRKLYKQIIIILIIYMLYLSFNLYRMLKESKSTKNPTNILENRSKPFLFNHPNKNWIVVTSTSEPTNQIKKLANTKDFQLCVVGDMKTNQNWNFNNTVYLNIKKQEILNYKIFESTPFNSYTRKNIGYLFAIQHGAKYIYDTDDDNEPLVNLTEYFNFKKIDYGMIIDCKSPTLMNPYAHFGQPLIWPRGFPLSEIHKNHYNSYICGKRKTSVVQQGVVNGDPDVDAIFRLTKTMNFKRINITFDDTSPSLQYPAYKLAPYNSQNTFFHYEAFWSLYLPHTVPFRLTDIWRSYWAQRLMWMLNDTVSFYGPNAVQFRNSHSYLKDFYSEKSMYSKLENLIEFLFEWKCSKKKFYECVIDLSLEMAIKKFWKIEEVNSIKHWLHDLTTIGYQEPKIIIFETVNNSCSEFKRDSNPDGHFQVRYTPKFQKSIDSDNYCCNGKVEEIFENFESIKYLENFCSLSNSTLLYNLKTIEKVSRYSKIILLITFNDSPYVQNIEVIRHIYGTFFKNIVFCGLNILNVLNNTKNSFKKFDSYTFIDVDVGWAGVSHYFCMTKTIEMQFAAEGILLMSDDVLLKYWKLDKYDLKKIWFPFKLECKQELVIESLTKGWSHWGQLSLNQVNGIWDKLGKIINGSEVFDKQHVDIAKSFIETISFNSVNSNDTSKNSNKTRICSCFGSDIFYLPKSYFFKFHFISSIFRIFNLHLEIALPTILAGIERNTFFEMLDGKFLWNTLYFDFSWHNYEDIAVFVHPSKISKYNSTNNGRFFCQKFVQEHLNKSSSSLI